MGLVQKLTGVKLNRMFQIYFILMFIIYTCFVLLLNVRRNLSEVYVTKADRLTPEEIETIFRYGKWSENIEISLIILFVFMGILSIYANKLWMFFKYNLILTISILMLSFGVHFITTLTLYELLEPLMNLSTFFTILLVYVLLAKILKFGRNKKYFITNF